MTEPRAPAIVVEAVRAAMALAGLGLLSYGSWLVYPPAGLIVPGTLLLAGSVVGAVRG